MPCIQYHINEEVVVCLGGFGVFRMKTTCDLQFLSVFELELFVWNDVKVLSELQHHSRILLGSRGLGQKMPKNN